MKNAFCFVLKALFVLKIFKFLYWFFDHTEKTAWLGTSSYFQNLWFYNLVNKQLQWTHCPIKSKGNQTKKFSQSIEYNKRIIFLQNHAGNKAERLVPGVILLF